MQETYKINYDLFTEEDFLKDCPNSEFIPTILPAVKRIIAIGDVHGDLDLAKRSLIICNVINKNLEWIAEPKNTVIVQVGDQIDSCRPNLVANCKNKSMDKDKKNDINVINFYNSLHKKAKKHGGAVYSLLGNHELMNVQGNFDYVSYNNYNNFDYTSENGKKYTGISGRREAFSQGGPVAKKLACSRLSVIIIGSILFVHGGILPSLANKLEYLNIDNQSKLKYLNRIVRKWLLGKMEEIKSSEIDSLIKNEDSPFWTRLLGSISTNKSLQDIDCSIFKQSLQVFRLGSMAIGHTPQMDEAGINGTCSFNDLDKLFRIDGAFSESFEQFKKPGDTRIQVLEIIDDKNFHIISNKN